MPFPYRQHPRLKNHDYTTPGSYFITVCTKNKQQLLWEPLFVGRDDLGTPSPGIEIHLSEYGKTINKYINSISDNYNDVSVDKYVIMPDHIHLLITLKALSRERRAESSRPTNISQIIGVLKRFVNNEVGENIFQTSFHDHIIRNENEYYAICNYIENNPEKWVNKEINQKEIQKWQNS